MIVRLVHATGTSTKVSVGKFDDKIKFKSLYTYNWFSVLSLILKKLVHIKKIMRLSYKSLKKLRFYKHCVWTMYMFI